MRELLSLSSISTNKKFQHSQGRRFWTGYKPSKALNFYKINETAAGVALVKAAAVGFTSQCMLITVFLKMKVEDLQRRRAPELLATKTRTENRPGDDAAPVLLGQRCPATGLPQHHELHLREPRTSPPSPPPRG